jgi:hypothetical protein
MRDDNIFVINNKNKSSCKSPCINRGPSTGVWPVPLSYLTCTLTPQFCLPYIWAQDLMGRIKDFHAV